MAHAGLKWLNTDWRLLVKNETFLVLLEEPECSDFKYFESEKYFGSVELWRHPKIFHVLDNTLHFTLTFCSL